MPSKSRNISVPSFGEEQLDITLLTAEYFDSLFQLINPNKHTRNAVLILLTLFHHRLDGLIDEDTDSDDD